MLIPVVFGIGLMAVPFLAMRKVNRMLTDRWMRQVIEQELARQAREES